MNGDLEADAVVADGPVRLPDDAEATPDAVISRILRAVRQHLDLDVAFIGEIVCGRRVFRYVDTKAGVEAIKVGDSDPLEESYCYHVLSGRFPQFLPDPMANPEAAAMPVTSELPVGSHLSVPIRFSDGQVYGTFCCFALQVRESLSPNDLRAMNMMAELAGEYLEAMHVAGADQRRREELVAEILDDPGGISMVFQPIRDLHTLEMVGLEALARFPGRDRGPDWFFAEAAAAGRGVELELKAARLALDALPGIPPPVTVSINVSPETLYSAAFLEAVATVPRDRLVVEVTEHAAIEDYAELKKASAELTRRGIWLAIDDVGMGFSGLNRILQSEPDELKLDAVVVRDVDTNPAKQALVEAFASFGRRAAVDIVAEGIETAAELNALQVLGIRRGQGYHLGRPAPLEDALSTVPAD